MILNEFPKIDDFYKNYWGKKPFVVRGGITPSHFDQFIDGDTLAGLALEEDIKSRIVTTTPSDNKADDQWTCEHGPFDENHFSTLGEKNWSLLVQNVDEHHTPTAELLEHFNFSPRWLLDDIMVSYSATGGSVGPHTDSYHVFLVQGIGRRQWRVGSTPVQNENCIEGIELKVLKDGIIEGEDIEVTMGDVIYLPPNFAHQGVTLEDAMTFSVGFLGPKMSELFIEYGYYLEAHDSYNTRYVGQGLDTKSTGIEIPDQAKEVIKSELLSTLQTDSFSEWLKKYFSKTEEYGD